MLQVKCRMIVQLAFRSMPAESVRLPAGLLLSEVIDGLAQGSILLEQMLLSVHK